MLLLLLFVIVIICGPACYCVIVIVIIIVVVLLAPLGALYLYTSPHPVIQYQSFPSIHPLLASRCYIQMRLHAENVKIQCAFKTPSTVGGFSCLMINIIILVPVYEAEVTDKGGVIARHHLRPDIVLGLVSFP